VQHGGSPETITADKLERLAAGIDMTAKVYMGKVKAEAFRDEIRNLLYKHATD
jgi:hypothetical protein